MAATDPGRRHPASFATARRTWLRAGPAAALLLVFAAALQAAQPVRTPDFDQMLRDQAVTDRRWREASVGFMRIEKITYRSRGDLEVPAYVFQPLETAPRNHPALVWVHENIRGHLY